MKRAVFVIAAFAVVICAMAAWSQAPRGMGGPMMLCPAMAVMPPPVGEINRMAETLQLTDDQATRLKAAITKYEEPTRLLSQKAADATKAFRDALLASDYSVQKVKDLAEAAEKAEDAVISARIDEWTQIRSILTADQAKKLQDMQRPGQGNRPAGPPRGAGGFPPPGPDGPVPPPDQD